MSPDLDHPGFRLVVGTYQERFGATPEYVVFSPGRINLIGEHTDYNHGYVLPAAIQYGIWFAVGPNDTDAHEWFAVDKGESVSVHRDATDRLGGWQGYLHGGVTALTDLHHTVPPVNCVFTSDLPIGAGLSSSSALTCGFLLALDALSKTQNSREQLAVLAHRVERNYVGLQGGIMDQHASLLAQAGQFLFLDCLDRSYQHVPFSSPGDIHLLLINTGVQHELTSTDYNARSSECRQALVLLRERLGIDTLREVMDVDLRSHADILSSVLLKRLLFVQSENQRVLAAVTALREEDWEALGRLLYHSHDGLRSEYEVSCPELDFLVDYSRNTPEILGARMMGGGFGGCTINLVKGDLGIAFQSALTAQYRAYFGFEPTFISVFPGPGGQLFEL